MNDTRPIRVLGISGSLRVASYNTAALGAVQELAPDGMTIETFDLAAIPLYNDDVRAAGLPPSVEELRGAIAGADALLFATPEYNYSIPGVLKNAIDWASRPPDQPFDGSPPPSWAPARERSERRAPNTTCVGCACSSTCTSSTGPR